MNLIIRPRRLRRTKAIREMVRENHLHPEDFIYPLFIHEKDFQEEISAMPGIYRWDMNCLLYTSPSPRDLSTSRMPSSA